MILKGKGLHYLAVKPLRGIKSKHHGDFFSFNGFIRLDQKKTWMTKKLCENKDFSKM